MHACYRRGDYDRTLAYLEEARDLANTLGARFFDQTIDNWRAVTLVAKGAAADDQNTGEKACDAAAEIFAKLAADAGKRGDRRTRAHCLIGEADALIQGADELRRERHAPRALLLYEQAEALIRSEDVVSEAIAISNQAFVLLHSRLGRDGIRARKLARRAVDLVGGRIEGHDENSFLLLAVLAEAEERTGEESAPERIAQALALYDELTTSASGESAEVRWHVNELQRLLRTGDLPHAASA